MARDKVRAAAPMNAPASVLPAFIHFHFEHPVSRVIEFELLGGSSPLTVPCEEALTVANDLLFSLLSVFGTCAQHSYIRQQTHAVTSNTDTNKSRPALLP